MSKTKPFPAIHGGCFCGSTRYRLETAPLFCYACHCTDCNKQTGSVYACFTSIENDHLTSIGTLPPKITTTVRPNGIIRHGASCGKCGTRLWASGDTTPVTADIATGTLDLPELMEPDLHSFIESKISWAILPEGTKTCRGPFDFRKHWPKSSLKRLEAAVQRARVRQQAKDAANIRHESEEEKEADKTPTAQTPDEHDEIGEDEEEFERRYRKTEKELSERLEQLSLRLKEDEKAQATDLEVDAEKTTPKTPALAHPQASTTAPSEN